MIPALFISSLLPKLLKLVLPKVIEEIGDVIKYAREDNVLDTDMKKIKEDVEGLKQKSHDPQNYKERCEAMEKRIERLENVTRP